MILADEASIILADKALVFVLLPNVKAIDI